MKKILLSAFAGLCIMGASIASSNNTGASISSRQSLRDTIPSDTSRQPMPDTASPKLIDAHQLK